MLPNFLVCGAYKCGTTSLYHYLKRHPDIFMASPQEVNFFDRHYKRGIDFYEKCFDGYSEEGAIGENSQSYLYSPGVPERIEKLIPKAKLIFILRNPITHTFSQYWFALERGYNFQDPRHSFSEAIRTKSGYEKWVKKSFYFLYLRHFLAYFPKKQMHFIIFEDFVNNTHQELQKCFRFLDVDENYQFSDFKKYNQTTYPINFFLIKNIYKFWLSNKKLKRIASKKGINRIRVKIRRLLFSRQNKPFIEQKDRQYLQEIYREPNRQLAEFLGKDLSFWK